LSDLVGLLSLAPARIAIELNQSVVRRNEWPKTILVEGDRVEIVHFVGGGNGRTQKPVSGKQSGEARRFLFRVATV
jgi:thiamine biosynthesis protein ThiS